MNLILFAGASSINKTVSFYHGDHLSHPPPIISNWTTIAEHWLKHAPYGQWLMDGERISNFKDQWVFVDVREI